MQNIIAAATTHPRNDSNRNNHPLSVNSDRLQDMILMAMMKSSRLWVEMLSVCRVKKFPFVNCFYFYWQSLIQCVMSSQICKQSGNPKIIDTMLKSEEKREKNNKQSSVSLHTHTCVVRNKRKFVVYLWNLLFLLLVVVVLPPSFFFASSHLNIILSIANERERQSESSFIYVLNM